MRKFLSFCIMSLAGFLAGVCAAHAGDGPADKTAASSATRLPNIVLIVSDDQGYADFGAAKLADDVKTPNLDRLADMGVRFTQAYATSPICSPSRAGLATGAYQERFGVWWYGGEGIRNPKFKTIAEVLKARGYRTGYFGKFHFGAPKYEGPGFRNFPLAHGFDELYGFSGGRKHYLYHDQAHEAAFQRRLATSGQNTGYEGLQMQPFWVNDAHKDQYGYSTELIGQAARDFVDHHRTQPFFAQISFNAVHNFSHQLPQAYLKAHGLNGYPGDWDPTKEDYLDWYRRGRYPNNPEGRRLYLGQLVLLDQEVGRILDHLEAQGLMDNTIVVFISDNGGSTPVYANNAPFRGGKYTLYEGGIRVPMIIAAPGRLKGGRTLGNMVSAMDILPTVAAAAGAAVPATSDGIDLMPLMTGRDPGRAHDALIWDTGQEVAVRQGRWKYRSGGDLENAKVEMVELEDGEFLHDLEADPGEKHNLASARPEILARMKAIHQRWRTRVDQELAAGND